MVKNGINMIKIPVILLGDNAESNTDLEATNNDSRYPK